MGSNSDLPVVMGKATEVLDDLGVPLVADRLDKFRQDPREKLLAKSVALQRQLRGAA